MHREGSCVILISAAQGTQDKLRKGVEENAQYANPKKTVYTNDGYSKCWENHHNTVGGHSAQWAAAVFHHRAVVLRSWSGRANCIKCDHRSAVRYGIVLANLPWHGDPMCSDRSFVRNDSIRKTKPDTGIAYTSQDS